MLKNNKEIEPSTPCTTAPYCHNANLSHFQSIKIPHKFLTPNSNSFLETYSISVLENVNLKAFSSRHRVKHVKRTPPRWLNQITINNGKNTFLPHLFS